MGRNVRLAITAVLIANSGTIVHSADQPPTVAVTSGQVRGKRTATGGAAFQGIPYAQPPTGQLRWRGPQPVKPWGGIRDATAFGAICPQNPSAPIPNPAASYSEDCLFLNVWTAEWPARSKKPVFFWIHGGGNFSGSSSEPRYDGQFLARRGIVVVTFNYRLGSFGFFSHPQLARESPYGTSGNQGLLDQLAALKWVRDNIASFGGDPNRITIGGVSAGAIDLSVLMTTALSKGMFHGAIGQSGAVGSIPVLLTAAQAEKQCEMHATRWGVPAGHSLADIRAVAATDILKVEPPGVAPYLNVTIDGYLLREDPVKVFAAGRQHRVPLLYGSAARDFLSARTTGDINAAIIAAYGPMARRAEALYSGEDSLYGSAWVQWVTDTSFRCPTVLECIWHAATGQPVFQYEFARAPQQTPPRLSLHANDATYVFGTLGHGSYGTNLGQLNYTAVDRQISEQMQQYWTNFITTGNPNGGRLPVWPRFASSKRAYLQFNDVGITSAKNLRGAYCDLFIEHTLELLNR